MWSNGGGGGCGRNSVVATATEATYGLSPLSAANGHSFTYQYDRNKNITGRTQNGAADAFTYDPLDRIQQESGLNGNKKYTYDQRGNIQHVEGRTLRGLTNANSRPAIIMIKKRS